MAGTCEVCGKTLSFGHNVSFSKKRTNRVFRPNIQKTTVYENGRRVRRIGRKRAGEDVADLPRRERRDEDDRHGDRRYVRERPLGLLDDRSG